MGEGGTLSNNSLNIIDVTTPKKASPFHLSIFFHYLSTLTVKDPCMSCRDSRYRTCDHHVKIVINFHLVNVFLGPNLINVLEEELVELLQVHVLRDNCNRGSGGVGRA